MSSVPTPRRRQHGGARGAAWQAHPGGAWLAAAVAVVAVASCATVDVESVVLANDADFGALRTFYIVPAEDDEGQGYPTIEAAIERELVERGRTRTGPEEAEMWVAYRASARDRTKRRNAGDPDTNNFRIVNYVEGTLAVDVFEQRAVRRIWHGQAVVDGESREKLREQVDRVVDAIFAEFPDS